MSDLISREELTKKLEYLCDCLCDYSKKQRKFMCDACKLGAVIDAVEEMTSVEQERKPGHWIIHPDDLFPSESTQECSECHEHQPLDWRYSDNYCPNCGAKMEVTPNE